MECLLVWKSRSSKKKIPGSFSQTGEIYYRLIRNQRLVSLTVLLTVPSTQTIRSFWLPLMVDSYRNLDVEVNNSCGVVRVPEVIIVQPPPYQVYTYVQGQQPYHRRDDSSLLSYTWNSTPLLYSFKSLELTGKVSHNLLRVNSNKVNYIVLVEIDRCMR